MGRLILRSGMTETEDTYIRDRLMAYNLRMAPPAQNYTSKSASLFLKMTRAPFTADSLEKYTEGVCSSISYGSAKNKEEGDTEKPFFWRQRK